MFKHFLSIIYISLIIIIIQVYLIACQKTIQTNYLTFWMQPKPDSFPAPRLIFANNPLSKEGFELGRRLFYEGLLSIDSVHSCASCHQQMAAFGTYEHDRSHGVHDSHTLRNAPVLFNLAWSSFYHWDGNFTELTSEVSQPILGATEMGSNWNLIIDRLKQDKTYVDAFQKVFNNGTIKPEMIAKALTQFTGYLVSANSKYDLMKKGAAVFTTDEQAGYQIFKLNCAICHVEPLFTDYSFRNIGLAIDTDLNDFGRMRITNNQSDYLKFKVPTLRNVYLSANYMHDGRYNTLAQVLTHYRTGVIQSQTVDTLIKNGIALSNTDVTQIIAFLKTLTDTSFINNTLYKMP